MHLGNGAVTPGCAAVTFAAAGSGITMASLALRRAGVDRARLLAAGALTGAIFAGQMVNVPVLPFSSAHLVGGVLAAWVLGPALGALSMSVVLTTQALLLGDGGLMALGANILNMGLLPAGFVHIVRRREGRLTAGFAAAAAVVAAALAIVGEVALLRAPEQLQGLASFAWQMIGIHLWIALPEGLLTVAILSALGGCPAPGRLQLDHLRLGGCWGVAALFVICFLPFASPMPDGYEAAGGLGGMSTLLAEDQETIASLGTENPAFAAWQHDFVAGVHSVFATEQFLGLISTAVAGLTAWGLAKLVGGRRGSPLASRLS
jgi:cobalt/nickel transport system permease protein